VVGLPILTNSCRSKIHGKYQWTHSMDCCDYKLSVLCAHKFHSGSKVHYNIETSNESPVVTTRAKSKAQEAASATTLPTQSDEGSDEAESNGDNPPVDNTEEGNGNDDTEAEESGDKENAAEKSNERVGNSEPSTTPEERSKRWFLQGSRDVYYAGLNLNEKWNPSCSIQEEPKIQINALNEVPDLKRLFEGYNMYWMAKTPGKYNMEMVRVRAIPIDISERTITRILMGGDYTVPIRTTEYDYQMEAMKGIRKLSIEEKVLHFQWMANIIVEDKEGEEWVTGIKPINKASLNFLAKSWLSIVQHRLAPTVNDNVLITDSVTLHLGRHDLNLVSY
ncbi:hypothetical protein HAX54_029907, partial [Datura stramonium]|nr:hypothetical protein [Datura stramonium]